MSFSEDIKKDLELEEIDVEETDCDCEYEPSAQDMLDELSVAEEIRRIDNFDKDFEVSEETRNSEFYKATRVKIETLVDMMKIMVNNGIDYNNSLAYLLTLENNKTQVELAKQNSTTLQQQQI